MLNQYSSQPGQPYPLNVRLPLKPVSEYAQVFDDLPVDLRFRACHTLYLKKLIRLKKSRSHH